MSFKQKMLERDSKTTAIPPHLIVQARAGTGKTTTLLQGLRIVMGQEPTITPSPQQQAVWDAMALSAGSVKTAAFVAFNRSVKKELEAKVPTGVLASTNHGLGFRSVMRYDRKLEVFEDRSKLLALYLMTGERVHPDRLGYELSRMTPTERAEMGAACELVGLCKMTLTEPQPQYLAKLVSHHGIDLEGVEDLAGVYAMTQAILDESATPSEDGFVDYDDMIWLPIRMDLLVTRFDLLLVDEWQDLNAAQHELMFRSGKRLVLCGDDRQAIYGFTGAETAGMEIMFKRLSDTKAGCVQIPLTVTRRCGKAIVERARKIVPDFEALDSNPQGEVVTMSHSDGAWRNQVGPEDMVVCRVNAPLVSEVFKFLKAGKRAVILGKKDVERGLLSLVAKLSKGAKTIEEFIPAVEAWSRDSVAVEKARGRPSEPKMAAIRDKADCLICFAQECGPTDHPRAVEAKIRSVFTEESRGKEIRLSTIHKAKGLEASTVVLLCTKGAECPHPMAKKPWERVQEMNLLYVATTRAIHRLLIVS